MSEDELVHARTAILRAISSLTVLPEGSWQELAAVVDDQLHVAWASGYYARAYEEEAARTAEIQGVATAPVPAATAVPTVVA